MQDHFAFDLVVGGKFFEHLDQARGVDHAPDLRIAMQGAQLREQSLAPPADPHVPVAMLQAITGFGAKGFRQAPLAHPPREETALAIAHHLIDRQPPAEFQERAIARHVAVSDGVALLQRLHQVEPVGIHVARHGRHLFAAGAIEGPRHGRVGAPRSCLKLRLAGPIRTECTGNAVRIRDGHSPPAADRLPHRIGHLAQQGEGEKTPPHRPLVSRSRSQSLPQLAQLARAEKVRVGTPPLGREGQVAVACPDDDVAPPAAGRREGALIGVKQSDRRGRGSGEQEQVLQSILESASGIVDEVRHHPGVHRGEGFHA